MLQSSQNSVNAKVVYLRLLLYGTCCKGKDGRGQETRPAHGHLLGGWSQWRNRLPRENSGKWCAWE